MYVSGLLLACRCGEANNSNRAKWQRREYRKGITTSPYTIGADPNRMAERRRGRLTDSRALGYRAISVYLLLIATMTNQVNQLDPQAQWELVDVTTRENDYQERQYAARDRGRLAGLTDESKTGVKNVVLGDPSRMDDRTEWFGIIQRRVELMRQFFDEKSLAICRDPYGSVKLERMLYDLRPHEIRPMVCEAEHQQGWWGFRYKRTIEFPDVLVENEVLLPVRASGKFWVEDSYWIGHAMIETQYLTLDGSFDEARLRKNIEDEDQGLTAEQLESEVTWRKQFPLGLINLEYVEITYTLLRNYYVVLKRNLLSVFPCLQPMGGGNLSAHA